MLTEEQIQYLYKFCEKKGVRYYDLQTELVDHLSEAIEAKIAANAALSFDEALMSVYKGFGITGFSRVIAERETALTKSYNRARWRYFKDFFTYPKIAVSLLLFFLLNAPVFIFKISSLKSYHLGIVLIAVLFGLLLWASTLRAFKKPARKLMVLKRYGAGFGIFGAMLQVPNLYYLVLRGWDININNLKVHIAVSCFAVLLILVSLAEYYAYANAYREVKKRYPQAFTGS
ncbi:hypothetical protein [Niabella aquatica]